MNKSDVVVAKCKDVAHNMSVYFLHASEILEVFVVSDNHHLMLDAHEEMTPVFQSVNNGEEFLVPYRVVSFSCAEGFRGITDRSSLTVVIVLPEDCSGSFI